MQAETGREIVQFLVILDVFLDTIIVTAYEESVRGDGRLTDA